MDPNRFTYDQIQNVLRKKGYKFNLGKFELNLVGIRASLFPQPNKFDDVFAVAYIDAFGAPNSFCCNCTTDPGTYWLNNPLNVKGTGILKEGQYPDVWSFGLHDGKYQALIQTGLFTVYRDNNKDSSIDLDPATLETGYFGINMHHAAENSVSTDVEKWSAGCTVIQLFLDFKNIMKLCKLQPKKVFTYTLLSEQDFIG